MRQRRHDHRHHHCHRSRYHRRVKVLSARRGIGRKAP
jgi:hypothetical protein